ncbi:hypothetical protein ACFO25_08525 [Paenactinomyces guangxiensis]|uniref:Uncharacterized protein n=1 Tax=Paenactinomyces guangxiensis TaxID=1490290 RepID=A0A7W1WMZ9_9BACL|nr:hypothetical protein [Paenactinomyces guangxiensis]MBA4492910.1 hypothetical protein [Paenactinomyces guangxiensis]MBH8590241.1 hypothetical protein [Paenactinomyces guangxiensis]
MHSYFYQQAPKYPGWGGYWAYPFPMNGSYTSVPYSPMVTGSCSGGYPQTHYFPYTYPWTMPGPSGAPWMIPQAAFSGSISMMPPKMSPYQPDQEQYHPVWDSPQSPQSPWLRAYNQQAEEEN